MNKEEGKEIVKVLALAGLPLILSPVGTALLTLANECFNSSAKMRQDEWMKTLAERIDKQDDTFAEKIRNTQNFASLFANAQNGALTDMEEEKIGLYAHAFINAIKNEKMEDTKKHIFLNMLRKYSNAHIKILHFINNQEVVLKQHPYLIKDDDEYPFETHKERNEALIIYPSIINNFCKLIELDLHFWDLIVKELYNDHLIRVNTFWNSAEYKNRSDFKSATYIGQEFLSFIAEQENVA